jgi:hypothetical protein
MEVELTCKLPGRHRCRRTQLSDPEWEDLWNESCQTFEDVPQQTLLCRHGTQGITDFTDDVICALPIHMSSCCQRVIRRRKCRNSLCKFLLNASLSISAAAAKQQESFHHFVITAIGRTSHSPSKHHKGAKADTSTPQVAAKRQKQKSLRHTE